MKSSLKASNAIMRNPIVICTVGAFVIFGAWILLQEAQSQTGYYGVPAVPCIDPTKPVEQNFSFMIYITVEGKSYPLSPSIGYDPGTCLRVLHTNNASGQVFVQSNDARAVYTLKDFFETWHQEFSRNVIMGYKAGYGKIIRVRVNGEDVPTAEETPVHANDTIEITTP